MTHVASADIEAVSLGADDARCAGMRVVEGLEIVSVSHDVLTDQLTPQDGPSFYLVWGSPDGDANLVEVREEVVNLLVALARQPGEPELDGLDAEEIQGLRELGVLVPTAWDLQRLPEAQG